MKEARRFRLAAAHPGSPLPRDVGGATAMVYGLIATGIGGTVAPVRGRSAKGGENRKPPVLQARPWPPPSYRTVVSLRIIQERGFFLSCLQIPLRSR